jgi:phosphoribosylformimino-5-aminoimidazole carboxamide ribotide isomerase/imidazole glycerol phosphate synthase glutamine amidotransferase subunit
MTRVAILDYGMGNLRSVEKALERVGADTEITWDPAHAAAADGVILPGVGAFPRAMERVRQLGLDELVAGRIQAGAPVLGICLGLQLLFESSVENEGSSGLALLDGVVAPLEANGYKVPHIGWSPVHWERDSELTEGLGEETPFYFVHSFAPRPTANGDVLGTAAYGQRFACAVERPPLYGVQFHPEKSSSAGLSLLFPAIDIRDGKAVRLVQGDFAQETKYDDDPVVSARRWVDGGATWLHIVDLDGARAGEPVNLDHVRGIVAAVNVPVQLGGGLRDSQKVEEAISSGAERVVLGTAAVRDPEMAEAIAAAHGDRVVASVDARSGKVAAEGWTEESELTTTEVIAELTRRGLRRFVYTPVEVDGLMEGPNLDSLREAAEATDGQVIYSGGIGSLDHLRAVAGLGLENVEGVIVGRALYEQRFTITEARAALGA